MDTIIVTGLSGAGKTQTLNTLEDLGYYCVDNMPPSLIVDFMKLVKSDNTGIDKVAFGIDIRGGQFFEEIQPSLDILKNQDVNYKILFLDASDEILIRRFNETRRKHPLSIGGKVKEGIKKERILLKNIRDISDFVINTTNMKVNKLNQEIRNILEKKDMKFVINVSSFGFKNGIPLEGNMVFDVRFITNPYHLKSLRKYTGNNKKIISYVMKHEESQEFMSSVKSLVRKTVPFYIKQGKFYLNLSFGCTGGKHRSVVMANVFCESFKMDNVEIKVSHRDCNSKK